MAGTRVGGLKAVKVIKERLGEDWYEQIGRRGGQVSRGGGFTDREFASEMGKKARQKQKEVNQAGESLEETSGPGNDN
jgi:general stress protein YciG